MLKVLPVFLCLCAIGCTTDAETKTLLPTQSSNMDVGQYSTEAEAKPACGADQVVWEDTNTGVLYPRTDKFYGSLEDGAYMCKSFAQKNGMVLVR